MSEDKAKKAIAAMKKRGKHSINNKDGKKVYRRVTLKTAKTETVHKDDVTEDIALLALARQFIVDITESNFKIEELTYGQKQGILWFLNKYLPYLTSAVDLKTKFMSTSISLTLPDNLILDTFQRQAILDYHTDIMDKAESVMFNLFKYYNLFGNAYILSSDTWEPDIIKRLAEIKSEPKKKNAKNEKEPTDTLEMIKAKLEAYPGLKVSQLFKFFEKNPEKAHPFFEQSINATKSDAYKKLEEIHASDPSELSTEQLVKMRELAFPLWGDFNHFLTGRSINPAYITDSLKENPDTGDLSLDIEASQLLLAEPEFQKAQELMGVFHSKHTGDEETEQEEDSIKEDFEKMQKGLRNSIEMLAFKGYDRALVEAHLYSEEDVDLKAIRVTNDAYVPLHVFRIKDESVTEDLSNADTLIESAIDLYNCETRQRSYINDTREKLVTVDISAAADANLPLETIDEIVDDIASSVMTGESNIISLPEGISLSDQTDIIRASNDTDKLETQSKTNIALFFGMSLSMLEDSEAVFSNTYLKIDTAQNVFSYERMAIAKMIEEKILKPASVKAGMFCKNRQGKTVVAVPDINFTRISIGRHSEDYNAVASLVQDKVLPKSHLYEYHNTSKEDVSSGLIEDAMSLDNPDILEGIVSKIQDMIYDDPSGQLLRDLLKGDTMNIMKLLKRPMEKDEPGVEDDNPQDDNQAKPLGE